MTRAKTHFCMLLEPLSTNVQLRPAVVKLTALEAEIMLGLKNFKNQFVFKRDWEDHNA